MTTYGATNSTQCACKPGFQPTPTADGSAACADVDECALKTDTCDAHAFCTNLPGSFSCSCEPGYAGDGFLCVSVDECDTGADNCDPHAACVDTPGSFYCACRPGFIDAGPPAAAAPGVHCVVNNRLRAAGGGGGVGPTLGPIANQQARPPPRPCPVSRRRRPLRARQRLIYGGLMYN